MPTLFLPATVRRFATVTLLALGVCALSVRTSHGQPQLDSGLTGPHLLILTPPGGKVGTTVEVACTGTATDGAEKLLFNHPNIKAELIEAAVAGPPQPKRRGGPKTSEVSKFKVTIGADVTPGIYDARLVNKHGISNPRAFVVGNLNEVMEKEPNNDLPQAQRVDLNSTINGNLTGPTDVDYYVFAGKKNQRVVFSCLTSSIDSRMHPGLEVYDVKGKLLAFNRNYSHNDALTDVTLPEDGDYYVRLYEFTHTQGTAEHFYRLSITTAPWVDAVYPSVFEPGKTVQATVYGRNLPGGQLDKNAVVEGRTLEKVTVSITAPKDPVAIHRLAYSDHLEPAMSSLNGAFEYRVKNGAGSSNAVLLSLATSPVVVSNEKSHTLETAQPITLPCEIMGRVMQKRDRDWYVFSAKKGEVYNIEIISDRLGVVGYMHFVLRNFKTQADVAESQDDNQQMQNVKFYSRSNDPLPYRFTAPADGQYGLMVNSRLADSLAGPRQQYLVRITPDQPDFEIVALPYSNATPEAPLLHQGGQQALTVYGFRRDSFKGPIALSVEGLPAGVTCPPQTLAHGLRHTTLVLSAADNAVEWTGAIKIKGTATINGQKVTREARAGGIVWPVQPQQGIVPISRLERGTFLAVREKPPYTVTASIDKAEVQQGTRTVIKVQLKRLLADFKTPLLIQATPGELPQGFSVNNNQPVTIPPGKNDATLNVVIPSNAPPGAYNIVLRATAQISMTRAGKKGQKQQLNVVLPTTPVTLTVLPKSLGTISLSNNVSAKIGKTTEYVVKVTRLYDFDGEYKIKVVLPPGVQGVTVDEAVIPPGKDEVKLMLKVAPDAKPGNRSNLRVVATALWDGKPITQEAKFNVNVVK